MFMMATPTPSVNIFNTTDEPHTGYNISTLIDFSKTTKKPDMGHGTPIWLVTINALIGTCGLVGNSLVVVVFLLRAKRTFKNWTQMYILHQSTIDCLASCLFLFLRFFNDNDTLAAGESREILLCKLWFSEYFLWALFMVSTYNLVLVSLERFLAIVKPVWHRNKMSRRKVLLSMLMPWIWAFVFQSYWPPVYELYGTDCFPVWPQDWLQPLFGVLTFLFEYFLPLMVMVGSYGSIIYKLKHMGDKRENNNSMRASQIAPSPLSVGGGVSVISNIPTQHGPTVASTVSIKKKPRETNIYSTAKRNVIKTLMAVFIVYVLSWTPTEIEFLLYNLKIIDIDFSGPVYRILSLIVLANMIANPIIYAGFYKDFQKSFKGVLMKCGSNRVDIIESHTVATESQNTPHQN